MNTVFCNKKILNLIKKGIFENRKTKPVPVIQIKKAKLR